jgi:hypothetical protein
VTEEVVGVARFSLRHFNSVLRVKRVLVWYNNVLTAPNQLRLLLLLLV